MIDVLSACEAVRLNNRLIEGSRMSTKGRRSCPLKAHKNLEGERKKLSHGDDSKQKVD